MSGCHSKRKFKCAVNGCDTISRGDSLYKHYRSHVKVDTRGNVLVPGSEDFKKLKERQKSHTLYFYENNFTHSKFPPLGVPSDAPKNPWHAIESKQRKRQRSNSNSDSDEKSHQEFDTKNANKKTKTSSDLDSLIHNMSNISLDIPNDIGSNSDNECSLSHLLCEDIIGKTIATEGQHEKLEGLDQEKYDSVNFTDMQNEYAHMLDKDVFPAQSCEIKDEFVNKISQETTRLVIEALNSDGKFPLNLANKKADLLKSQITNSNNENEVEDDKYEATWELFEDTLECLPCKLYKYNAPSEFNPYKQSKFGVLLRENGNETTNIARKRKIRENKINPLHVWCVEHKKKVNTNRNIEDIENLESGKNLLEMLCFAFSMEEVQLIMQS